MYEIHFAHSAEKTYSTLDSNTRKRINVILEELEKGNLRSRKIRALHGPFKGAYRFRAGDWRMIFQIDHSLRIIYVSAIVNRKDAY